jgi:hypothetical protein
MAVLDGSPLLVDQQKPANLRVAPEPDFQHFCPCHAAGAQQKRILKKALTPLQFPA